MVPLAMGLTRAFSVKYQTEAGEHDYVWSTSWGLLSLQLA